ncbi:MAG: hypothetical protein K0Q43_4082 [Ramlibacter sp.]|nr:hypothetical protein [Ramlibacter sp.]
MRSNLANSALVRILAQWTPAPEAAEQATADIVERLGEWVSAFDAIELHAAQQSIRAITKAAETPLRAKGLRRAPADLCADFDRARMTLARAISLEAALPNEFTYAPYKRRHFELQRQMDQLIGVLRDHVREVLSGASAALRQLATLDAALQKVTAPREQALLPVAAALLERRFEQLRKAHVKDMQASAQEDDPATWRKPGRWLHAFEIEWRQVLLAELEVRLEPIAALVEAGGCELKNYQ